MLFRSLLGCSGQVGTAGDDARPVNPSQIHVHYRCTLPRRGASGFSADGFGGCTAHSTIVAASVVPGANSRRKLHSGPRLIFAARYHPPAHRRAAISIGSRDEICSSCNDGFWSFIHDLAELGRIAHLGSISRLGHSILAGRPHSTSACVGPFVRGFSPQPHPTRDRVQLCHQIQPLEL